MKKGILVLSSLVALVGLTGCGKKLTCTMDNSSLGLEAKSTVEVKFKGDSVDSMKVSMDITIPEEYMDEKDDLINQFKDSYDDVKVTEIKNGIRIEADENSSFFQGLDVKDKTVSYDDVKKAFEGQGYTCK